MRIERLHFRSFNGEPEPAYLRPVVHELIDESPPPPSFNEEDLAAAHAEGFKRGYEQGLREGEERGKGEAHHLDMAIKAALQTVVLGLHDGMRQHNGFLESQNDLLSQLAYVVAKKIAGDALEKNPLPEIERLLRECLPIVIQQPSIILFTHPDLVYPMTVRVKKMLESYPNAPEFSVHGDEKLLYEDARIEWKNGGAERRTSDILQDIQIVLEKHASSAETMTESKITPLAVSLIDDAQTTVSFTTHHPTP